MVNKKRIDKRIDLINRILKMESEKLESYTEELKIKMFVFKNQKEVLNILNKIEKPIIKMLKELKQLNK